MSKFTFDISRVVFVYARDGEVKCFNHAEALECAAQMLRDGWKQTGSLDGAKWIEHLCNDAGSSDLTDERINELRGAV